MTKHEVLKLMQEVAREHGYNLSLEKLNDFLKIFDESYVRIGDELEFGETAYVGVVAVEKKKVEPREGTNILKGVETHWSKPARSKVQLKARPSFLKENEKEI